MELTLARKSPSSIQAAVTYDGQLPVLLTYAPSFPTAAKIYRIPSTNLESTDSSLYTQAQEVFDTMAGMNLQQQSSEAGSIFSVTCRNGHVSYFDKGRVCSSNNRKVVRGDGVELDEIYLKCSQCDDEMIVHVNCEAYR